VNRRTTYRPRGVKAHLLHWGWLAFRPGSAGQTAVRGAVYTIILALILGAILYGTTSN
jgi:hypothetical protein